MSTPTLVRVAILCAASAISVFAVEKPSYVAAPPKEPSLYARTLELWSDHPDYVAQLRSPAKSRAMPKLLKQVPPEFPPMAVKGKVTVMVSLVIDATGAVEAARAVTSDDPRFNDLATAAVKQWKFAAADPAGDTRRIFSWVPVEFAPAPNRDIRIAFSPRGESRPRTLVLIPPKGKPASAPPPADRIFTYSISLAGAGAADVRAGRVLVHRAFDDLGTELHDDARRGFVNESVGVISDEMLQRLPPVAPMFSIAGQSPQAAATATVEGKVELVIPTLDPAAVAVIGDVPAHFGTPLDAPELAAVGVKLVLRDHTAGPPPRGRSVLFSGPDKLQENDVVLDIDDPQEHLVAMEFQTADGAPIRYAHNGWYHSSGADGKRYSIYRLDNGIPKDVRLVCWLATPKSVLTIPFRIENVPLVPPKSGA